MIWTAKKSLIGFVDMKFDPEKAVECGTSGCDKRTMNDDGICSVCAYIGKYDKNEKKVKPKKLPNSPPAHIEPAPIESHEIPPEPIERPPIPKQTHETPIMDTSGPRVAGDTRFLVLSCEAITLTHPKAKAFLEFNTYEAQRGVKARNLQDLEAAIREGRWRSADISIAVLPDGREILVNGQHTLTACVNTTSPIFVLVLRYAVKDEHELSALYRTFDLGRGARSISDAVKAELSACNLKWPLLIASLITSAAACIETGSFRPGLGKTRQSELVRNYKERGGFIVTLYEGNRDGFKCLRRAPVATAIIKSYMVSPDAAFTFWSSVRDGGGDRQSRALRKYLMDQPETWDRQALYNKCVEHYNAFAGKDARIKIEQEK